MQLNFKDWLLYEVGDILNRDIAHINLTPTNSGFKYYFKFGEADFTVSFDLASTDQYGVEKIYAVNFLGPNGYKTTGQSGTSANVIYTQLLLAVKKLFETTQVDGLYFTPAEPQMGLIYRRFFNQYLKKDFMQVTHSTYLRKDKLRDALKTKQGQDREQILRSILSNRREVLDDAKEIERKRLMKLKLKKRLNNFVKLTSSNRIGYLYAVSSGSAQIIAKNSNGQFRKDYYNPSKIDLNPQPEHEIQEFMNELVDIKNNNAEILNFIKNNQEIKNWMKHYGIEYQDPLKVMEQYVNKFYQYDDYTRDKIVVYIYKAEQSFWDDDHYYLGLFDDHNLVDRDTFSIRRVHSMDANVSEDQIKSFLKALASIDSRTSPATEVLEKNTKLQQLISQYGIERQ